MINFIVCSLFFIHIFLYPMQAPGGPKISNSDKTEFFIEALELMVNELETELAKGKFDINLLKKIRSSIHEGYREVISLDEPRISQRYKSILSKISKLPLKNW